MKKYSLSLFVLFVSFVVPFSFAQEMFPREGWKDSVNPFASADAERGGTITLFAGPTPKSFNYYLDQSSLSATIFGKLFESLLGSDPISLEDRPGLAQKWSISDDKKTFTFWMDPMAKWSDGTSITAHDVKWTYDAIMDPKNLTGPFKVGLARFESVEVVDDNQIKFTAKNIHWSNLNEISGFGILPKHVFEEKDFNKVNFEFPVVSGAYELGEYKEGFYVKLKRRHDTYWGKDQASNKYLANFNELKYRFYEERENAFDAFQKGEIDIFPVYTAHRWVAQTDGEKYQKNWIIKQKIYNDHAVGFQGFAMNMRRPPFDDIRVRQAMTHLVNRPSMNETLMHKQYALSKSYYPAAYSSSHPCGNELIPYDPEKAASLLDEAGWMVNPETGIREKDGKALSFSMLTRSSTADKFMVIFGEDLKKAGVELKISKKDWAAWAKDMDEFNYDMTWAAWGAGTASQIDPETMWYSKEGDRPSGFNITGLKNPRVDELIEKQKTEFDVSKRLEMIREIDDIIYKEVPYVLLWNLDYIRLLYWNKFGKPDTILGKYGTENAAYTLWWIDPDSEAGLKQAMENDLSLPPEAKVIRFGEVYKPNGMLE